MPSFEPQSAEALKHLAVVIPALHPGVILSSVVDQLAAYSFATILVIDDGSNPASMPIFEALQKHPSVLVLHHAENFGKGKALKTGFEHVLQAMPNVLGVVTADADGQHTPADIARVAAAIGKSKGGIVLGTRMFTGNVPARCRIGNTITRKLFRLFTGVTLSDTQTGLRGIPRGLLAELIHLDGDRYDYETTVLLHVCRFHKHPSEIPIDTLYLDGNSSSHFRPITDSLKILSALIRFVRRPKQHQ